MSCRSGITAALVTVVLSGADCMNPLLRQRGKHEATRTTTRFDSEGDTGLTALWEESDM